MINIEIPEQEIHKEITQRITQTSFKDTSKIQTPKSIYIYIYKYIYIYISRMYID